MNLSASSSVTKSNGDRAPVVDGGHSAEAVKIKSGDLVHVTTHDIEHGRNGWTSLIDIAADKPLTYEVVGWIVKAGKRTLTIAPMTSAGNAHCYYRLPRGAIVRVRRLK